MEGLEADTGVKLRVLAQNYPQVGGWVFVGGRCLPEELAICLTGCSWEPGWPAASGFEVAGQSNAALLH